MNLLIDIGNSRIKWGLASNGVLHWTAGAAHHADWLDYLPLEQADSIWLASVAAPEAADAVAERAAHAGLHCSHLTAEAHFGRLENGYSSPARLGVDRWMACIGAVARYAGSVMIVDAGTALTLDWIDADCRHQGGLITPGIATMRQRLSGATQLALPDGETPDTDLGTSPPTAIERGTRYSAIALIDEMARRYPAEHRLLTGGESGMIASELGVAWDVTWDQAPDLVLEGLAQYSDAHSGGLPNPAVNSQNRA